MVAIAKPLSIRANLPTGLGYTSGKYYGPANCSSATYTTGISFQNKDQWVPFYCRKTTTFDRIALYNTAAVTINFRLAIYNDDGGGHPGTLLVDAGQLTTAGAAGDNAATISQSLTGGNLYWLVSNAQSDLGVQVIGPGASNQGIENILDFALPAASVFIAGVIGPASARSYAAFPANATAYTTIYAGYPFIRLRAE